MVDDANDINPDHFFHHYNFGPKHAAGTVHLYNILIMRILKKIWQGWKSFGFFIGNIISSVFLFVFYFSVFALFAIPYRIFNRSGRTGKNSNFSEPVKQLQSLEDFKNEY